ncbi:MULTISPECIES: hypothetical protein [Nocardioides]|uniref:Uncharacterized protein n=1 Tax=Nocardioides vastitatis TaxID=2568655 RepID=A0ABW0ZK30_9ACTN|nr:hypothetical protein [Nocardioides sp.]
MTTPDESPRRQHVARLFDFSRGRRLEIGLLDKPLVSPSSVDVRYADGYPRERLVAMHRNSPPITVEDVPEIDFPLWGGAGIRTFAERRRRGRPSTGSSRAV